MRFGLIHRIMTDALATLGVLALVASGQFDRTVSITLVVALALALIVRDTWQRFTWLRHADSVALIAVLVTQIVRFVLDASVLDVVVEFAAALQIIRLATRKGAAHDQQVIVLALLHLIAGTVLGGGLGYGLCFLGVLIVAPGALVLSHLRREVEGNYRQGARDRTGLPVDVPRILRSRRVVGRTFLAVMCLLSIPIFVFTGALFVVFPRVGLSLLSLSHMGGGRVIGFSGRVDLGEVGVLRSDPTIALRVEIPELVGVPPPRLALHLRGTALDFYDGRAWTQSLPGTRPADTDGGLIALERYPDPASDAVMRMDLESIDPAVVFLPPYATGLRFAAQGQLSFDPPATAVRGAEGEVRYQPADDRGLKYEVFVSRKKVPTFRAELTPSDRARYLQLPERLSPRIRELGEAWTAGAADDEARASAVEHHLHTEYRYDLDSPSGRSKEPLDDFLFESKRGHCEYYSTAMAVLLRTAGVPTRNVTGFVGGTWNRFGNFYAVRQGDAHSWVEVYLEGRGWITYDPTPPADAAPKSELDGFWATLRDVVEAASQRWDRHVVGYDLDQQVGLFQALSRRYKGGSSSAEDSETRVWLGAGLGGVVALAFVGRYLLRRRAARKDAGGAGPERTASERLATALYEELEGAMAFRGVPRAPGTPPLSHAVTLQRTAHPLASEILTLTRIYLGARFGGEPLSDDAKDDFAARVRTLRTPPRAKG